MWGHPPAPYSVPPGGYDPRYPPSSGPPPGHHMPHQGPPPYPGGYAGPPHGYHQGYPPHNYAQPVGHVPGYGAPQGYGAPPAGPPPGPPPPPTFTQPSDPPPLPPGPPPPPSDVPPLPSSAPPADPPLPTEPPPATERKTGVAFKGLTLKTVPGKKLLAKEKKKVAIPKKRPLNVLEDEDGSAHDDEPDAKKAKAAKVPPPNDPEETKFIESFAARVLAEGVGVETQAKINSKDDPQYRFLTDMTGNGHWYYKMLLREGREAMAKNVAGASDPAPTTVPSETSGDLKGLNLKVLNNASSGAEQCGVDMMDFYAQQAEKAAEASALRRMGPNGLMMMRMSQNAATAAAEEVPPADEPAGHHIGDFLPPDALAKFHLQVAKAKSDAAAAAKIANELNEKEKIKSDNIGHKMLAKMGWKGGGLGAAEHGIVNPIQAAADRLGNEGIGAGGKTYDVAEEDDEFAVYKKKMQMSYQHRPNPLNNPRKPYY